jgi:hypothetical protein
MEHSSSKDPSTISALFYYPIKSLVYCGALRFTINNDSENFSKKFVPLDSDTADLNHNLKNPPLFVVLLKGVDSKTRMPIIECNVFVIGMKKTAISLVEFCQEAFGRKNLTVYEFYKRYGNIPVVYCSKNELSSKNDCRVSVKHHDLKGYYYATETTPIDLWQLFESNNFPKIDSNFKDNTKPLNDQVTVKWLTDKNELLNYNKTSNYDIRGLLYNDELGEIMNGSEQPPALVRQERTPSPIIFEKYIKKKQPQVIIKEIYVTEAGPPPLKIVENIQKQNPNFQCISHQPKPIYSSVLPKNSNRICQAVHQNQPIYGQMCPSNYNNIRQGCATHENKGINNTNNNHNNNNSNNNKATCQNIKVSNPQIGRPFSQDNQMTLNQRQLALSNIEQKSQAEQTKCSNDTNQNTLINNNFNKTSQQMNQEMNKKSTGVIANQMNRVLPAQIHRGMLSGQMQRDIPTGQINQQMGFSQINHGTINQNQRKPICKMQQRSDANDINQRFLMDNMYHSLPRTNVNHIQTHHRDVSASQLMDKQLQNNQTNQELIRQTNRGISPGQMGGRVIFNNENMHNQLNSIGNNEDISNGNNTYNMPFLNQETKTTIPEQMNKFQNDRNEFINQRIDELYRAISENPNYRGLDNSPEQLNEQILTNKINQLTARDSLNYQYNDSPALRQNIPIEQINLLNNKSLKNLDALLARNLAEKELIEHHRKLGSLLNLRNEISDEEFESPIGCDPEKQALRNGSEMVDYSKIIKQCKMSNKIAESYLHKKSSTRDIKKRYSDQAHIPSKHEYDQKYRIHSEYPEHYEKHKQINRYSLDNEHPGK